MQDPQTGLPCCYVCRAPCIPLNSQSTSYIHEQLPFLHIQKLPRSEILYKPQCRARMPAELTLLIVIFVLLGLFATHRNIKRYNCNSIAS
ncbi:hypothetical protein COCMIDRAFT_111003 [Bipolaris oryzae ATCC 44560]|uniref:Uncharacterized protein n=1 Tax=Bipolaris oryzae ATCC 44560 TaxID=930090 RepID=W6Z7G5_COCMI|nr:uncharacterized protein COCMIDRAFT_111003 [Bipolaris oryzae ATCC 44560]EUC39636.1 hypothetical protein COCMIDRAFT_111003 [Bipolaris oryzae ATCC 44560]